MQYLGRLIGDVDADPCRARIAQWGAAPAAEKARLAAVERWRERLIEGDQALTDFAGAHSTALNPDTLQQLRTAIRMSRKERGEGKPPRHFRELFRLIRDVVEGETHEAQ